MCKLPARIALEQQPIKNLLHFLKGRVVAKLGHRQRVRGEYQLVDFIVARQIKSDFHSMDSNRAGIIQAAFPVPDQTLIDRLHDLFVWLSKGFAGQVKSLVPKQLLCVICHSASVAGLAGRFHSYFPVVVSAKNFAISGTGNYRKFS